MAKKTLDLDTPFRKNEKVMTTRDIGVVGEGAKGKVQLHNGLGPWLRYWVIFDNGRQVGQVNHADLVRPFQLDEWQQREEDRAAAAERAAQAELEGVSAAAEAPAAGGGGGGLADQIPAALLERSKAAKARLLGS